MTSITSISLNRDDSDNYNAEQRKLEERRRALLHARGRASLSLSSLEDLATARTLNLANFTSDSAGGFKTSLKRGFFAEAAGDDSEEEQATKQADVENREKAATHKKHVFKDIETPTKSSESKIKKAIDDEMARPSEGRVMPTVSRGHLDSAHRKDLYASEPDGVDQREQEAIKSGAKNAHSIAGDFDKVSERIGKYITTGSFETEELNALFRALQTTANEVRMQKICAANLQCMKGNLLFLDGLVKGMNSPESQWTEVNHSLDETYSLLLSSDEIYQNELVGNDKIRSDNEVKKLRIENEEAQDEKQLKSRHLEDMYRYLDSLSAAASATTGLKMADRINKVLQSQPVSIIQKLAVSGAGPDVLSLVSNEAERRLLILAERLEGSDTEIAHANVLKTAISQERARLKYALASYKENDEYQSIIRSDEQTRERRRTEKTVPNLVANNIVIG